MRCTIVDEMSKIDYGTKNEWYELQFVNATKMEW